MDDPVDRLPSLSGLRAFALAGRSLSFRAAAARLSVTPTAVSHRIRRLEEELGARLFRRGVRQVALTEAGAALLPDTEAAFARLGQGVGRLRRSERRGVLTVSTVASFAVKWLVPRLGAFQAAHPDIDVRIATTMAAANFTTDGVDVAVRYGRGRWPGLSAVKLMAEEWLPVCAPELARGGRPLRDPADLAAHTALHVSIYADEWRLWLTMAGFAHVTPARNLTFDDSATLVQAAVAGLGVALGRRAYTEADLAAGRLIAPFDIHLPQDTAFYVVAPEDGAEAPKVTAFRDWILAEAAEGAGASGSEI